MDNDSTKNEEKPPLDFTLALEGKEMPAPPPPPPPRPSATEDTKVQEEEPSSSSTPLPSPYVSPLKAAADLIQTLDLAYAEMSHSAADAARDAEQARRNSRIASEIARRYLHRSYPNGSSNGNLTPLFGSSPKRAENKDLPPRSVERHHQHHQHLEEESKNVWGTNDPPHEQNANTVTNTTTNTTTTTSNTNSKPPQKPEFVSPGRNNIRASSYSDRIAQSHAEEVFALTMELERSKNDLKSEQRTHDDTKVALSNQKMRATSLEEENKRLREQLQQIDRERNEKIWNLEHELAKAKLYVEAAEEDAQLALDLAKESSEKRDAMEDEVERVLEELQTLKEQPPPQLETPRRSVRFADVAATAEGLGGKPFPPRPNATSPAEMAITPVKQVAYPMAVLPVTSQPNIPSSSRNPGEFEDCKHAAKLIQESGRRLELAGHWWRKGHENPAITCEMEAITRQYCQSVEVKMERQQKEIKELESLCGFLEKKLVTGTEEP